MELSEEEQSIQKEACEYVKENQTRLIDEFVIQKKPLRLGFISIFMAGSPGAGKTEFSTRYMPRVFEQFSQTTLHQLKKDGLVPDDVETLLVRIDVDEIRKFIPQYKTTDLASGQRGNAHVIQRAANKGLDILRDYCLKNEVPFLLDGTFGNLKTMRMLIKKSLDDGRAIHIFFIYLDPLSAWDITQKREALEGRNILKEKFVQQYFAAQENVEKIKKEFGKTAQLHVVLKNPDNSIQEIRLNAPSLDSVLNVKYKSGSLRKFTPENLAHFLEEL